MKRVLLTGASGFIGRPALAMLQRAGYEVHAVSRGESPIREVHWHRVDLLDPTASADLLIKVRPTHLLHLAWYAEPGKFWTSELNRKWTDATAHLAEIFVREGGRVLVAAGSCAEYEWSDTPCDESHTPVRPVTEYGVCKDLARQRIEQICGAKEVRWAWGRIFHLFGPGEHPERFVASVIDALLRRQDALCTHGRQIRDFLHVADAAAAFVTLLDGAVGGPVNIGSGRSCSLADVARRIEALTGETGRVKLGARPAPAGEPPLLVPVIRRIAETGWTPRYDLDGGLRDTIEWRRRALNTGDAGS